MNQIITELIPEDVMFNYIGLREPYKENVFIYQKTGINPLRQAEVELYYYQPDKFYLFIVDLLFFLVLSLFLLFFPSAALPDNRCGNCYATDGRHDRGSRIQEGKMRANSTKERIAGNYGRRHRRKR